MAPDTWIDLAARLVASEPGAAARLLRAHHPRPDGRCAACPGAVRWPCAPAVVGRRAEPSER